MSSKARRRNLIASGLCVDCAVGSTVMGHSRCKACKLRQNEYARCRRLQLAAMGMCIDCAVSRPVEGQKRCYGCAQKQKTYAVYKPRFEPPAIKLSSNELYKRVKSEREIVSWAWRNRA